MGISSLNKFLSFMKNLLDNKHVPENQSSGSGKRADYSLLVKMPFERATPEEVGIGSETITRFLEKIVGDETVNMHGLMIVKDGKVVFETGFGQRSLSSWRYIFSASKSVTALAIGLLVDEGKLSVNDKAVSFFDEINPIIKIKLKDLTVENLLTMQSGASFNEIECLSEKEWIRAFFNSITLKSVGKVYNYNSLNTYILSAIVCKITGKSMSEYLKVKLFDPLMIDEFFWELSPENIEKGGWGLFIKPEDLAKIGYMMLSDGVFDGKQIISKAWIEQMTAFHAETPKEYGEFNYAYQTWCGRDNKTFLFNGMFGQNMLCFKQSKIMLLSFAGNNETFQQNNYFKYALETFGGDFEKALPPDKNAYKKLCELKKGLTLVGKDKKSAIRRFLQKRKNRKFAKMLSGKRYEIIADQPKVSIMPAFFQIVQNCFGGGLESIELLAQGKDKFFITYNEKGNKITFPIGLGKTEVCDVCVCGGVYKAAFSGNFSTDEDNDAVLSISVDFLEIPFSLSLKLFFKGEKLILKQKETPSYAFLLSVLTLIKSVLSNYRIIGTALSKVDDDYIKYLSKRTFSPTVVFEETKDGSRNS